MSIVHIIDFKCTDSPILEKSQYGFINRDHNHLCHVTITNLNGYSHQQKINFSFYTMKNDSNVMSIDWKCT